MKTKTKTFEKHSYFGEDGCQCPHCADVRKYTESLRKGKQEPVEGHSLECKDEVARKRKRDEFAMTAMQALISSDGYFKAIINLMNSGKEINVVERIAEMSLEFADALLKKLEDE